MSARNYDMESTDSYMAIVWNACCKRVRQSPTKWRLK